MKLFIIVKEKKKKYLKNCSTFFIINRIAQIETLLSYSPNIDSSRGRVDGQCVRLRLVSIPPPRRPPLPRACSRLSPRDTTPLTRKPQFIKTKKKNNKQSPVNCQNPRQNRAKFYHAFRSATFFLLIKFKCELATPFLITRMR